MRPFAMHFQHTASPALARRQHGMALVSALLLLVVLTILGVGMFRNFGIQERLAGNTRDKQRALHAAEATQSFAETWLKGNNGGNASTGIPCPAGSVVSADAGVVQVCTNTLATVATASRDAPLNIGGTLTAVTYTPPGVSTDCSQPNCYVQVPQFYISFLQGAYDQVSGAATNTYVINALAYGASANTIAEVESGYTVNVIYTTTGNNTKFINLGGS